MNTDRLFLLLILVAVVNCSVAKQPEVIRPCSLYRYTQARTNPSSHQRTTIDDGKTVTVGEWDSAKIREDFPYTHRFDTPTYFDSAATTQKPKVVIDAITNFNKHCTANIGRARYDLGKKVTADYEDARATVASFIGAFPEEVIFTSGSTEGINMIARGWGENHIGSGDEIVITQMEHHSNIVPWQQLAKRTGAKLTYLPINADGTLNLELLDTIITTNTRLVAFTHVSNVTGVENDVKAIVRRAREVGAKILVDGAQSVPHKQIDVHDLDCDFFVFSGHKLLGPTGIGVLYIKKDMLDIVEPSTFGGGMVYFVDEQNALWEDTPHRFEGGTPPIAQAIGLAAAIEYLQKNIDFDELKRHEASLCRHFIEGISKLPGIHILGPIEQLKQKGHLVSFNIEGIDPHDIALHLNQYGIYVRSGCHCAKPLAQSLGIYASVRASFYIYTTHEEVEACVKALQKLFTEL